VRLALLQITTDIAAHGEARCGTELLRRDVHGLAIGGRVL
jgi:hypothetical protein